MHKELPTSMNSDESDCRAGEREELTQTPDKFFWKEDSTRELIALYRENDFLMNHSNKVSKRTVWKKIADNMSCTVSAEQCEGRWKTIFRNFLKIKEINDKTGRGRTDVPFYYDDLLELMGDHPKVKPVSTSSSMEPKTTSESENAQKKKKKRNANNLIDFLTNIREEEKAQEEKKMKLLQKQHEEKTELFKRFLAIFEK